MLLVGDMLGFGGFSNRNYILRTLKFIVDIVKKKPLMGLQETSLSLLRFCTLEFFHNKTKVEFLHPTFQQFISFLLGLINMIFYIFTY